MVKKRDIAKQSIPKSVIDTSNDQISILVYLSMLEKNNAHTNNSKIYLIRK